MTSYLVLYTTKWSKLLARTGGSKRTFRLFRFGLQPHEIAAMNAR
ncbi:hypothetical protein [Skermanella mucosa]|nr:hypothetical protein [Skermanella mucosa]